jgi:hypothetical protein
VQGAAIDVRGEVWHWRGPAPHHFVTVAEGSPAHAAMAEAAPLVSYGWGMIPVTVRLGRTTWTTSLFPKDGAYVVPLKLAVRRAEGVELGDVVTLSLRVAPRSAL